MMQKLKGIKEASGRTRNKTPFTFVVWYDPKRNRVFTTHDYAEQWYGEYGLLGYIRLLEGSRHFTMKEITQRVTEYYNMVSTWEKGLS